METPITPQIIRDGATRAHMRLVEFLALAKVPSTTFYRWATDGKPLHPVNRQKLADALAAIEQEKAG